jgi:nucleoside-diphosphate-sugar epimerase
MARALVTGASGFIGYHLVKRLLDRGDHVTCFVRPTSDVDALERLDVRLVYGDVTEKQSLRRAFAKSDVVFHLAGLTKSLKARALRQINETGVRNVAECCADLETPPVLIVVSSLAAAGPASADRVLTEADMPSPISAYGRSKRAGELAAAEFAARVPITIVRPPIVLGEGDRDGLALFKGIANWGVHLVPTLSDFPFSVIHAADLAAALDLLAQRGRRIEGGGGPSGTYFAAVDETPTYAKLGHMIGAAVGRRRVKIIRNFPMTVWAIALIGELYARLCRRPHILNLDKAREATAGSWACSPAAIARDVGFAPARPLQERLRQTAQWYSDQGALRLVNR